MKQSTIIFLTALILAIAASFVLGYITARHRYDKPLKGADTTYITRWIHDSVPIPDTTRRKPVYVRLPAVHDTTEVHDTTTLVDSVLVEVPIEERTYPGENYRVVVSGYDPKLVDIWIRQKTQIVRVPYQKHWTLTIGPQVGYGFTPSGWQPYAGAGITFGYSF